MTATINVRNADFQTMLDLLNAAQARKVDLVVPANKLRFAEGRLVIAGQEMILEEDGFTDPNGSYLPTRVFDDQLAERLDIAPNYVQRLRHGKTNAKGKLVAEPRLDLYDANANGLLQGCKAKTRIVSEADLPALAGRTVDMIDGRWHEVVREATPADPRSFLVRLFRGERGEGVARALLSNRFARMDNLDGLMSMLQGIQDAGIDPSTLRIYGDLSDTRMYVHVQAPQILAAAEGLLANYRSPFDTGVEGAKRQGGGLSIEERIELGRQFRERGHGDGVHGFYEPGNEPLVHAGFRLTNSEVGYGRWTIVPEITVLRCSNGLTMTKDGFARNHVGSKLEDGTVEWSSDTISKELIFVSAQTRDIVKACLSREFVEAKIAELEHVAGKTIAEPEKAIEVVGKRLNFSQAERDGILRFFLMGGQGTTGGLMQAITGFSQTIADPDAAHDLNDNAIKAMELAFHL